MTVDQALEQVKLAARTEIAQGRDSGRRSAAEALHQAVRRLRKSESELELASLLVNTEIAHGRRIVCLAFEAESAHMVASRGTQSEASPFPIHDAPALVSVIETQDTVVTAATARELSEPLYCALEASELSDSKVFLVPVVVNQAVQLVLAAAEEVQPAALELLCESAGLRLEALALHSAVQAEPEPASPLVQITSATANVSWADLPQADQALHLRAQRFAQVAVARMRVEHASAVREGQGRGDLYSTLRQEIDSARLEYCRQFLTGGSKTMVDYLYLELVRSLANDEDRLLGPSFPGRLL